MSPMMNRFLTSYLAWAKAMNAGEAMGKGNMYACPKRLAWIESKVGA